MLASALLATVCYMHWSLAHMSHHVNVCSAATFCCCVSAASSLQGPAWGTAAGGPSACRRTTLLYTWYAILQQSLHGHCNSFQVVGHDLLQVGKYEDPATARRGESLYHFVPRSVVGHIEVCDTTSSAGKRKNTANGLMVKVCRSDLTGIEASSSGGRMALRQSATGCTPNGSP